MKPLGFDKAALPVKAQPTIEQQLLVAWREMAVEFAQQRDIARAENEATQKRYSELIAKLVVLSSNIRDCEHARHRLEQIRLLLIEVQNG